LGKIVKADLHRRVLLSKLAHNDDETQGYALMQKGPPQIAACDCRETRLCFSDEEIARGESVGGAVRDSKCNVVATIRN
jgi:hypothetical protein